jgi:predicted transposase YbfD/YdcC
LEVRTIRTSTKLTGYSVMPGLAQVAEIRSQVTRLKTGAVHEQVRYLFTSLSPEQADAERLLTLSRGHWQIENTCFHIKDDSFGEDRHVLQRHRRGEIVSLLRGVALNVLRQPCAQWPPTAPLTARAEWVSSRPAIVLARL